MANNLKVRPWVVDTPGASVLFSGKIKVAHLEYVGYTDASHQVEVQDESGNLVALLKGNSNLSVVTTYEVDWISGLLVPVNCSARFGAGPNLQSGVLVLYIL